MEISSKASQLLARFEQKFPSFLHSKVDFVSVSFELNCNLNDSHGYYTVGKDFFSKLDNLMEKVRCLKDRKFNFLSSLINMFEIKDASDQQIVTLY